MDREKGNKGLTGGYSKYVLANYVLVKKIPTSHFWRGGLQFDECQVWVADSTDRCNTLIKTFSRCFKV